MVEAGKSSRQAIAVKFGIGKSTVHDIHKCREKIESFAAMHNVDDISKRRRVDLKPLVFMNKSEIVLKQELKKEADQCEEEIIDSIEDFDYQEINDQDYEVVYEADLPDVSEDLIDEAKTSFSKQKKSKNTLTLREKYDVLMQVENGVSVPIICEAFNIGRTTAYDIIKKRAEIIDFIEKTDDNMLNNRRTFKRSRWPEVEERVVSWCETQENFTKQDFHDLVKSSLETARENGAVQGGFCNIWAWAKRFFFRHPEIRKKLVTLTGQSMDSIEIAAGIDYLQDETENLYETVEAVKEVSLEEEVGHEVGLVKRNTYLSLDEKLQVLDEIDTGKSVASIAQDFDVAKTTIYEIYKRRCELRQTEKLERIPRYPGLELELLRWCMKQKNYPLNNVLIADKALCLFDEMGFKGSFNPSYNWAKKFVLAHPKLCMKQGISGEEDAHEIEQEYLDDDLHDAEDIAETFELEENDELPLEYHEEHIDEELEAQNDEDLEIAAIPEKPPIEQPIVKKVSRLSRKVDTEIVKLIPERIALKSLKILIKYSEQQGHKNILSNLIDYQEQLQSMS